MIDKQRIPFSEDWGYLLFGLTHVILYFDPRVFVFARRLILSLYATKQNPLIYRSLPVSFKKLNYLPL